MKKAITVRLLDPTGHDTTGGRSTRPLIKFVHRLNIRMIISFLLHWSAGGPREFIAPVGDLHPKYILLFQPDAPC